MRRSVLCLLLVLLITPCIAGDNQQKNEIGLMQITESEDSALPAKKQVRKKEKNAAKKHKPTEEEILQQKIADQERQCDTLFSHAGLDLANDKIGEGISKLEEILTKKHIPQYTYINTHIMLANLSCKDINPDKLSTHLNAIAEYCEQHPEDPEVANTRDRLQQVLDWQISYSDKFATYTCGTWVSTVATSDNRCPDVILHISKNINGQFEARVDDRCALAESITAKGKNKEHVSEGITINNNTREVNIWFGDKKYIKGSPGLATFGVLLVNEIAKEVNKVIAFKHRNDLNSPNATIASMGLNFVVGMAVMLITELSVQKDHIKTLSITMSERAPGMAFTNFLYDYYLNRSDNQNMVTHYSSDINLYRINPNDNLFFATKDGEFFSPCILPSDSKEIAALVPQDQIEAAKDDRGTLVPAVFNKATYDKIWNTVAPNLTDDSATNVDAAFDFEHGVDGYKMVDSVGYLSLFHKGGVFTGLMTVGNSMWHVGNNMWNALKGDRSSMREHSYFMNEELVFGKFESINQPKKKMFTYDGQWDKGRFHGSGILTDHHGTFTGEFLKGKKNGQGKLVTPDGTIIEGVWKNGKLVKKPKK